MTNPAPITTWGQNSATPTVTTGTTNTPVTLNLWLPTWAGEVLHAYSAFNVFEPMVESRTISSGTTVEFPKTGTIALKEAWEAGEQLLGGGSAATRFSISLDRRPMAAHFELDNIQMMIEQFEYRQELARQAGLTLANERDRQIARLIAKGAAESSRELQRQGETPSASLSSGIDTRYAGNDYAVIDEGATPGTGEEKALAVLKAIEDQLVLFRELDVPEAGTMCAVSPALFHEIRRLGIADTAGDFVNGGSQPLFGGVATGSVSAPAGAAYTQSLGMQGRLQYMGATIMSSNHVASQGDKSASGDVNYRVDMSNVRGLIFQRGGVASVIKQGLKVDTVDDVRRNTVFTVASMFRGGGVLRPELCATISAFTA
jgi:hypothetical protein